MREEIIQLNNSGSAKYQITAWHFGPTKDVPKIYIQSSLHADELPGSLAAFFLHQRLQELEQKGLLKAHIVLVPLCNPIGLEQRMMYRHIGRFHYGTGQNFNRLHGIGLESKVLAEIDPAQLGDDALHNQAYILQIMHKVLSQHQPRTVVDRLHHALLSLAYDAQLVLDLHCDVDAVVHLYTTPQLWPKMQSLAQYLGSACQIIAESSGANSFDEVLSVVWLRLQQKYPHANIANYCASCTVELRGQRDLNTDLAQKDANAIVQFLSHQRYINLPPEPMDDLINPPHPLEGLMYVYPPHAGIVVYHVSAGTYVQANDLLAEIFDPTTMRRTPVLSPYAGIVFALNGESYIDPTINLLSLSCPVSVGNTGLSA